MKVDQVLGKTEISSWEPMTNPPNKSGRYAVAHRGLTIGNAYYNAKKGDTHMPIGWSQLPDWGPTHWLNSDYKIGEPEIDYVRFYQGEEK
jgi:hypothetical protein